jgi:hypothetical protein
MKLISFDVGILNMAYCILSKSDDGNSENTIEDWGIFNLTGESEKPATTPAEKVACSYCKRGAKKMTDCTKTKEPAEKTLYFCKKHSETTTQYFPEPFKCLSSLKKGDLEKIFADKMRSSSVPKWSRQELLCEIQKRILVPVHTKTKKCKTGEIGLVDIGRSMNTCLENINASLTDLTHVVIENQISPIATRMKTIQGMLAQYFIIRFPETEIEFVSSHNKLSIGVVDYLRAQQHQTTIQKQPVWQEDDGFVEDSVEIGEEDGILTDYGQNKKRSVELVEKWLRDSSAEQRWQTMFATSKKKDDLADCLLQGIWYFQVRKSLKEKV